MVLSPSHALLERIKTNTPKYFVNHAVSEYFFADQPSESLPGRNRIKVGYVGNLRSKYLDFPLLREVVDKNPQCDFMMVGDNAGIESSLPQADHVYFLGFMPNERLPRVLAACDILLLCYDTVRYNVEASNSHKIIEYLASGRMVVSTRILEYVGHPELVRMPEQNQALPALLQEIAANLHGYDNDGLRQRRIEFARAHTYSKQLIRIDGWIDKLKLS
jgi:glycosyltransferase involved in cell wall biosynthesis